MEAIKKMSLVNRVTAVVMMVALIVVFGFAPGAHAQSGNVYGNGQAQTLSSAEEGIVLQVSIKRVEPSGLARTGGATVGALFGGLLGSNMDYQARAAVGMLGATVGGFAGERVANAAFSSDAQEIVIGLKDPRTGNLNRVVTVVQPQPFDAVAQNDQVLVINSGGKYRVIKRTYDSTQTSMR